MANVKSGIIAVMVLCAGLAGCQSQASYPYSELETGVYKYVNKFSGKVPKGWTKARLSEEENQDVGYHDASLVLDESNSQDMKGRGRIVYLHDDGDERGLLVAYYDLDHLKEAMAKQEEEDFSTLDLKPGSMTFFMAGYENSESANPNLVLLARPEGTVLYAYDPDGRGWMRAEESNMKYINDLGDSYDACIERGTKVPKEQVQRYLDLTDRFNNTYFKEEMEARNK